jgi:hypothetical protein
MDLVLPIVAIVAVLGLYGTYTVSCGGDSPVAPDSGGSGTVSTAPAAASTTVTPAEPAAEDPSPDPCEGDASCGRSVSAEFKGLDAYLTSTNHHTNDGVVCYTNGFQGPGLPGTPVTWHTEPQGKDTVLFPKDQIEAAMKWGEEECERTLYVQGDVYRGDQCTGYILAVAWPQDNKVVFKNPECEQCEPGDWVEIERTRVTRRTKLDECPAELDQLPPEKCYDCYEVISTWKETNGCEERPQSSEDIEFVEVECPCVPVWGPWEIVDTGVVVGECEEINTLLDQPQPECQQTITTTLYWKRTQSCTDEVERDTTVIEETASCDCDEEGGGCHISNQGAPGATNFNVVLTKAPAHKNHTQDTHCPGDIFPPNECSCEQAEIQALQCGDPTAGGFFCKDGR